jgi:hypothetical protein
VINADLYVEVRTGRVTGCANLADDRALVNVLAGENEWLRKMAVPNLNAVLTDQTNDCAV